MYRAGQKTRILPLNSAHLFVPDKYTIISCPDQLDHRRRHSFSFLYGYGFLACTTTNNNNVLTTQHNTTKQNNKSLPFLDISCEASLLQCMLSWHPDFQSCRSISITQQDETIRSHQSIRLECLQRIRQVSNLHNIVETPSFCKQLCALIFQHTSNKENRDWKRSL